MNRRQAREAALCMIFDYSFHSDDGDGNEQLELYLDNFQDKDEKNISEDGFLEYVKYGVNYYGTPKDIVFDKMVNL